MTRPTVAPDFATDTNYPAGADPWSAQPNKISPGGIVATGFIPATFLDTSHVNFEMNNHGQWLNYLDTTSQIDAQWGEWSSPIGASTAYAGNFQIVWSGANAPTLSGCTSAYNAPYVVVDAPLNTNASTIYSASAGGLFITQSWLVAVYEADIAMSAIGANNATITVSMAQSANLSGNFQGAAFTKYSTDTNWQCLTNNGAATTTASSGVPPVANVFQRLRMEFYGSATTPGLSVVFKINGTTVSTIATNVDSTHGQLPRVSITATANTATAIAVGRVAAKWSRLSGL